MVTVKGASRKPPRFKVHLPLRFREIGRSDWNEGLIVNLSAGGMCFESLEHMLPDREVELLVETKDKRGSRHFRFFRVWLVWKNGARYGVRFLSKKREPA